MNDDSKTLLSDMVAVLGDVANGNLRKRVATPSAEHPELEALATATNRVIEAWRNSEIETRKTKRILEAKVATIETQTVALRELSTPVMEIWQGVLLLPLIGSLHEKRSEELRSELLDRIVQTQSSQVIVDVTGVEIIDTSTADYLVQLARAANLLGARCLLTGVRPAVAQTLVSLGTDLVGLRTLRSLADGLLDCIDFASRAASR